MGALGAAVDATARAAAARFNFDRAEDNLKFLVQDARSAFEGSREYREAVDAEQRAFDELRGARAAAIGRMAADPDHGTEYRELISLRNEFTQRIAERRQIKGIPIDDIVSLAAVKLGYASSATAMEVTAEMADPRISDARLKLMDTGTHLAELEKGFAQHVREAPEMVAARAKIEDARLARLVALTVQEGAAEVATDAMDYLYYTHHRFDSYYGSTSYYTNLGNLGGIGYIGGGINR
jgi:hypothetical protein